MGDFNFFFSVHAFAECLIIETYEFGEKVVIEFGSFSIS